MSKITLNIEFLIFNFPFFLKKRTPVLDESLVEHTSEMRGAIPVLPIPLAWFCLILNCILPGVGTFFL